MTSDWVNEQWPDPSDRFIMFDLDHLLTYISYISRINLLWCFETRSLAIINVRRLGDTHTMTVSREICHNIFDYNLNKNCWITIYYTFTAVFISRWKVVSLSRLTYLMQLPYLGETFEPWKWWIWPQTTAFPNATNYCARI